MLEIFENLQDFEHFHVVKVRVSAHCDFHGEAAAVHEGPRFVEDRGAEGGGEAVEQQQYDCSDDAAVDEGRCPQKGPETKAAAARSDGAVVAL